MQSRHHYFKSKYLLATVIAAGTIAIIGAETSVHADNSNSSTVPVQILGINDFHGNIATTSKANMPTGTIAKTGTAAELAGYLNKYTSDFKSANPTGVSFRVQAGDMISASPAESALIYDQPTLAALHAMNIQVGTLGNHEFDKGLSQLKTILSGKDPVPNDTSAASQFYKEFSQEQLSAGYQEVVANLVDKSDGKIPNGYQPYTVLNKQITNTQNVYRLYNPSSGEHFYTMSSYERNSDVKLGWKNEGIAFQTSAKGAAVYRLYNKNTGEHFYTTSAYEKNSLIKSGWSYENIAYHTATAATGTAIYRIYNPQSGLHFYTTNAYEKNNLVKLGWRYESIAWYAAKTQTVKIGVIGVITTSTPSIVVAKNVEAYNFTDPATAIAKYSKELRAKGVNAIVVLGHTASDNLNGANSPVEGETADIIKKLDQIDPKNSVDLYVAGHSHTFTNGTVNGVRVVQALSFGEAFDNVKATYNFKTNDFSTEPDADIVPVDQSNTSITPDVTVANIVTKAKAITDKIASETIGKYQAQGQILASGRSGGDEAFNKVHNLPALDQLDSTGKTVAAAKTPTTLGESALGEFITKAQWWDANQALNPTGVTVDFAITNNGGIRSDLNADSVGNITWGDAQTVQPFRNVLEVVSMTGEQIKNALNEQTYDSEIVGDDQLWLQEYGINYTVTKNPDIAHSEYPYAEPYVVSNMTKLDGTPIELNQSYHVVINEFIKGGGDGFNAFKNTTIIPGYNDIDTDAFINYIKSIETVPTTMPVEKTYDASGVPLQ
ncbi:5'-nucleotidase C-terminal domain-containing protein [Lactococcus nasutitermitis]|uniref:5'-nucleotidase C-terminal domain-containing protein n=1 Tax=Lactococcus nasutitermitis TaxID=1652957 RepID=A0ABV9JDK7_9LACT|nr:5'-nucleotidase C-terminal domain-containing protein [Lactococcus nasutitermitis]